MPYQHGAISDLLNDGVKVTENRNLDPKVLLKFTRYTDGKERPYGVERGQWVWGCGR